jgi:hypothetical protein
LIQRLQAEKTSDGTAYFFFDHSEMTKRKTCHFLAAIIFQLMNQDKKYLKPALRWVVANSGKHSAPGSLDRNSVQWQKPATLASLETIVFDALDLTNVVLIVDAPDEAKNPREITSLLARLTKTGARILFASRPNVTIRRTLESIKASGYNLREVTIGPNDLSQDIQTYVSTELETLLQTKELTFRDPQLKTEIVDCLTARSNGM